VDFVNGPIGGGPPLSRVSPDWTFEVSGLMGLGVIGVDPVLPWAVRRVMWNGRDVTNEPLDFRRGNVEGVEIELTTRFASLSGTALDGDAPATDFAVIVFAEDRALWAYSWRFIGMARANQQGQFSVGGLPPGAYLAAAVRGLAGFEWQDPETLDRLRLAATRVTLVEGDRQTLTLRLGPR
jgi:hypothetical protein